MYDFFYGIVSDLTCLFSAILWLLAFGFERTYFLFFIFILIKNLFVFV